MARTKYTVTFPAAKAGDEVTWPNSVKVYADANIDRPMSNGYIEASAGSFTGWSDAASVTFTRAGTSDSVTVTTGSPTGTGAAVPSAASSVSGRFTVGLWGLGGIVGPYQADPTVDLTANDGNGELLGGFPFTYVLVAGSTLRMRMFKVAETVVPLGYRLDIIVTKLADATGVVLDPGGAIGCERSRYVPASVDANTAPYLTFEAANDSGIDDVNFSAPDDSTITFVQTGTYQITVGLWAGAPPSP